MLCKCAEIRAFAPNILAVENKRVVLGEVCRNLSVAFAEVRPPSVPFSSSLGLLLIILSAFSLFLFPFARSFFSFSSFPFPLGAYLRPPVSDPPFGFFSPFLSFFFLLHAHFSPFHPSRSLWAHICAHPLACAPPPLCQPPAPKPL